MGGVAYRSEKGAGQHPNHELQRLGFRVQGEGLGLRGLGFRVQGSGFSV